MADEPKGPLDYPYEFDGAKFHLVRASHDGGVSVEVWRNYWEQNPELVMEAIWTDDTREFRIRTSAGELPFALWELFMNEAARWVPMAAAGRASPDVSAADDGSTNRPDDPRPDHSGE